MNKAENTIIQKQFDQTINKLVKVKLKDKLGNINNNYTWLKVYEGALYV